MYAYFVSVKSHSKYAINIIVFFEVSEFSLFCMVGNNIYANINTYTLPRF